MRPDTAARRLAQDGDPATTALLSAHLGMTPEVLSARLSEISVGAGGRATDISVSVTDDGQPAFSGQTTIRDTARLVIAIQNAFPERLKSAFEGSSRLPGGTIFVYDAGFCAADAEVGETSLLVISAGADQQDCTQRAMRTGSQAFALLRDAS